MADTRSAWGIDIGQAGLKAIKLRLGDEGEKIRAVAFDYIPHPKILSQPDAIPEELIRQSVETFVGRNKVKNDLIAISVSGHTSMAKFIKLPPVEPSKVAEIVRYEAKQQIPFDLDDVVWDYQTIGGGVEESGFMLEAEVGLFAMKRDLVYAAMQPFVEQKLEVELVQVAPLALYNYLSYDVLGFRSVDGGDPPDADDHYIVLDMGADNTTLMVSNGRNMWIRNVPYGGNHFTRALTREMKLTFAKAEHLKCNATKAPDPKAVFQAMRPVFNDVVTEIQRSIGYFGSVNRSAKIKKVIGVGNGFKMAGLQKFLQQNLQYEVQKLEDFQGISGEGVLSDPLLVDNAMTFAVPYGLALQSLKQTRIKTTLLPPEIVVERTIRRKKPWAVGMAAGLLLTVGVSTFLSANVLRSVSDGRWGNAHAAVSQLDSTLASNQAAYDGAKGTHENNKKAIDELTAPLQKKVLWLELMKAINDCLPRAVGDEQDITDITLKKQLHIEQFSHKRLADVKEWHTALVEGGKAEDFMGDDAENPPEGEGYIVTLSGYHNYNPQGKDDDPLWYEKIGFNFVNDTLIENMRQWRLDNGDGTSTPIGQMGISHPVLVWHEDVPFVYDPNGRRGDSGSMSGMNGMGGGEYGGGDYGGGGGGRGGNYGGGGNYGAGMGRGIGGGGAGMGMGIGMGAGEGTYGGGAGDGAYGGGMGGVAKPKLDPLDEFGEEKAEVQQITRTQFVVQFAFVPVNEADRKDSPEESTGDSTEEPMQ